MRSARVAAAWSVVLAASAPVRALAAPGQDAGAGAGAGVDEARSHYRHGVQLYEAGAYVAALAELREAYDLAPTYKLFYNLALVQMRLGDFVGALHSLHSYAASGGADIPSERRTEVSAMLTDLGARVATLDVVATPSGAEIRIDGQFLGSAPLAGLVRVNPGPHHLVASREGLVPDTRDIDLEQGQRLQVSLRLSPPTPAPFTAGTTPPPAPPDSWPAPPVAAPPPPRSLTWVGWTVTGGLAAGALATGIAALVESRTLSQEMTHPSAGSSLQSTRSTTVTLALASDLLTCAGLVAGGATLYFTIRSPKHGSAASAELHLGPGSLAVVGSF